MHRDILLFYYLSVYVFIAVAREIYLGRSQVPSAIDRVFRRNTFKQHGGSIVNQQFRAKNENNKIAVSFPLTDSSRVAVEQP